MSYTTRRYAPKRYQEAYEKGRADERERCRAELRAKVAELDDDVDLSVVAGMWIEMVRWAREEAFGGE
jgi:hypothetical protein